MRIGHHRPLFCLCAVWMLAAGLGCVLSGFDGHRMLPAGAVCAGLAAGVLSVCLLLRLLRRITARRARAVGLALLCAGLSLLNSGAYFSGQVTPDSFPGLPADSGIPASDGAGEDAPDLPDAADAPVWEVRAVVAERLGGGSQITGYGLILRTVQGEPVGSALRPARAYLLCTYAANLQPGYEILLRAGSHAGGRRRGVGGFPPGRRLCAGASVRQGGRLHGYGGEHRPAPDPARQSAAASGGTVGGGGGHGRTGTAVRALAG